MLKKKLTFDVLRESTNHRFAEPVNTTELKDTAKGVTLVKMEAATNSVGHKNFLNVGHIANSTEAVPINLLQSHDAPLVCKQFCCFILETRKSDGPSYLPLLFSLS